MKCPKCGYISFDYNDTCPKCNKDLSAVRGKLNLYSFEPNPPSLLGALTSQTPETQDTLGPTMDSHFDILETEIELSTETDTQQTINEETSDSEEIEIELGSQESGSEFSEDDHIVSVTSDDTIEADDTLADIYVTGSKEDDALETIELELDTPAEETSFEEIDIQKEEMKPVDSEIEEQVQAEEISLSLDDSSAPDILDSALSFEGQESEATEILEEPFGAIEEDLDSSTDQFGEEEKDQEIPLSLEDLKDDELGEVDVTISLDSVVTGTGAVSTEP